MVVTFATNSTYPFVIQRMWDFYQEPCVYRAAQVCIYIFITIKIIYNNFRFLLFQLMDFVIFFFQVLLIVIVQMKL